MTKGEVRSATLEAAAENPSFSISEVVTVFASKNKLKIDDPQDARNLELAIVQKNPPTGNATRRDMTIIFYEMLKDLNKTLEHLPLKMGGITTAGQDIRMSVQEFKDLGNGGTLEGDAFSVMFAALRGLRARLVSDKVTAFDGYYSLKLVVWCLTQVAVEKHLVRNVGMCVLWQVVNA